MFYIKALIEYVEDSHILQEFLVSGRNDEDAIEKLKKLAKDYWPPNSRVAHIHEVRPLGTEVLDLNPECREDVEKVDLSVGHLIYNARYNHDS